MNPPTMEQTKLLHARWQQLTGLEVPYDFSRHFAWEMWISKGLTIADLETIVAYIKKRIKQGRREKESLMFRNMVNNVDNAIEDLSIARAESRNSRTESPKAEILRAAGYVEPEKQTTRPVSDVLAAAKALDDLRKWRMENGI